MCVCVFRYVLLCVSRLRFNCMFRTYYGDSCHLSCYVAVRCMWFHRLPDFRGFHISEASVFNISLTFYADGFYSHVSDNISVASPGCVFFACFETIMWMCVIGHVMLPSAYVVLPSSRLLRLTNKTLAWFPMLYLGWFYLRFPVVLYLHVSNIFCRFVSFVILCYFFAYVALQYSSFLCSLNVLLAFYLEGFYLCASGHVLFLFAGALFACTEHVL